MCIEIRGVNIPGIGGQRQTEWGVNMQRNVQLIRIYFIYSFMKSTVWSM